MRCPHNSENNDVEKVFTDFNIACFVFRLPVIQERFSSERPEGSTAYHGTTSDLRTTYVGNQSE
jgi:hypothetical protein